MVGRRPQRAAYTSAYFALSSARSYPSSSRVVRLSNASPVFLWVFPFVWLPGGDTQCPSVVSYPAGVPYPGLLLSSDLFNHVCDLCFSLTWMFVFLSRYVMFKILSIFVCAAASLFFAWVVSVCVSVSFFTQPHRLDRMRCWFQNWATLMYIQHI